MCEGGVEECVKEVCKEVWRRCGMVWGGVCAGGVEEVCGGVCEGGVGWCGEMWRRCGGGVWKCVEVCGGGVGSMDEIVCGV